MVNTVARMADTVPGTKTSVSDLVCLGGRPAFERPLHVGRPNIPDRQALKRKIDEVLDSGIFTNRGPMVRRFEHEIAELAGVKHCIAMCNGTVALEIAIRALGLAGEVLIPSMTFVATAHALQWQQITPVFCDIEAGTHHLAPALLESMITPRTSGILGVNLWGKPCRMESISAIAEKHRIPVIYDSAHAFGCSYQGKRIGGFGEAEVFSFHATKFLNTFEGGAVVTNNDKLADSIRYMQNFGFADRDCVEYIGINGKMSELQAAMGLVSLRNMDEFIDHNHRNYQAYIASLDPIPGLAVSRYDESEASNYQYIVAEVDADKFCLGRDQLMRILQSENVDVRRYFYPGCHRMEPYRSYFPHAGLLLPETERVLDNVLVFPTGTAVSPHDIERIAGLVQQIFAWQFEIQDRLESSGR